MLFSLSLRLWLLVDFQVFKRSDILKLLSIKILQQESLRFLIENEVLILTAVVQFYLRSME